MQKEKTINGKAEEEVEEGDILEIVALKVKPKECSNFPTVNHYVLHQHTSTFSESLDD